MGGYQDYYKENLDEYEDDEAEGERYEGYVDEYEEGYEEAQEEDPQPPKEVQDYLVLRQRLKDEKRRQMKKDLGFVSASSRDNRNPVFKSNDNYGSFFGSSQPVIASRVIQESKSLLENPHLLEKVTKAKSIVAKSTPDSGNSKPQATVQAPKVINGVAKKVQMIRKIRDYSFLDSDDPEPQKAPPPKPEARTGLSLERNKDFSSSNGRQAVPNHRDDRKSTPVNGQTRPNVGSHKQTLSDPRKQLPGSNGAVAHDRNRLPSKVSNGTQVAQNRSRIPNQISNGTVAPNRDRIPSKISSGPGRPMVSKSAPPKSSGSDKRVPLPAAMASMSLTHKTAPSRPQPSGSKPQQPLRQQVPVSKQTVRRPEDLRKRESVSGRPEEDLRKQKMLPSQAEELRRRKMLVAKQAALRHDEYRKQSQVVPPRQGAPAQKPKVAQPPPRSSVRPMAVDDRYRKRKPFDDDDEAEDALAMIRKMTGYDPSRYRDDDDTSNMEAGWEDIEREEKKSAWIAKKEDAEELLKIEEEERRERMRKEAKKRKLQ